MPNFTTDWFSSAEQVFSMCLEHFKGKDNLQFLEIGTFEGRSAIWLLDNILTGKNCKITCVDTFKGTNEFNEKALNVEGLEQKFRDNMKPYLGKYRLIKGDSQMVMREPEHLNRYDMIYIDGSHEASDTLEDIIINYKNLKNKGYMIFDDYMWNWNQLPDYRTPKIAVDAVLSCFKPRIKVIQVTWKSLVIQKLQ